MLSAGNTVHDDFNDFNDEDRSDNYHECRLLDDGFDYHVAHTT